MTEEKKGYPDGSIKTTHAVLDMIKMNAKIYNKDGDPIGKTGMGAKLLFSGGDVEKLQIPEGMISGKGLKVPKNAKLLRDLEALDADDDVTIIQEKVNGYWNIQRILKGHVGEEGVKTPGSGDGSTNNSGGGKPYNPAGAIIGMYSNWAMQLAIHQAAKSDDLEDVISSAIGLIRGADPDMVEALNREATKLYKKVSSEQHSKDESDDEVEEDDTEEDDAEEEEKEEKSKPKKARRGRPKKVSEDEPENSSQDEDEKEDESKPKKRGRGRPRKEEVKKIEEEEDLSDGLNDDADDDDDDDDLYEDDIDDLPF